jgi:curli biogenesis system outer membrane secretion channel CsgG
VNRSSFQNGIFSNGTDRLGGQAKTTLMGHLQQTNRFSVLDRDNMEMLASEAKLTGTTQTLSGAKFVVTGDVTEFGRKNVGDKQLFGLLGKGKSQIAYAKVTLNIVDVTTSELVFSSSGAGEYSLSDREVVGFGSTAGYDSTLNGKVLDLAVREAVNNLVSGIESGSWNL